MPAVPPRTDYHMHTRLSCDGRATMEEMCRGALEHGLDEIAITDHFDGHPLDECHDFYRPDAYFAELARCRELFAGRLTIRAGVEVGDPHRFHERLAPTLAAWPYDFAIGSVHWIEDVSPFGRAFFQRHAADAAWSGYFREIRRLAEADLFDVVGHIDMIKREGTEFYGPFDRQPYAEIVRETLAQLIARGKGIEINTSGFRKSANEPCPGLPILRWYAELGGEILTIGSDAHGPEHIALRRADAVAMAREAGLRWLTTFEARRPTQHPL
jgi:histidinol-phosphatase (PHP family)